MTGVQTCALPIYLLVTSSSRLHGLPFARRIHLPVPPIARATQILREMLLTQQAGQADLLTRLAQLTDCNILALAAVAAKISNNVWPTLEAAVRSLTVPPRDRVAELECGELSVVSSFRRAFAGRSRDELRVLRALGAGRAGWWPETDACGQLQLSATIVRSSLHALAEANLLRTRKSGEGLVSYRVSPLCTGAADLLGA